MKKKLLLDENLPNPLKNDFSEALDVTTAHDRGWTSLKNGKLLAAMVDAGFDYFITVDKNLPNQQNLSKFPVKLIVIRTFDNRYKTLKPLVPIIEVALKKMPLDALIWEIHLRK
jgi:predicted nuclease of predicted toxin-antitoxin system